MHNTKLCCYSYPIHFLIDLFSLHIENSTVGYALINLHSQEYREYIFRQIKTSFSLKIVYIMLLLNLLPAKPLYIYSQGYYSFHQ